MLFKILSTQAAVTISTVNCSTVNQEPSSAPGAPSPASSVTTTAKVGLPLETQGAIGEWNDQDKKRAANADPEPSLLTEKQKTQIRNRKKKEKLEADPVANMKVKEAKEKRRIYDRDRRQKEKDEQDINPAAKKKAMENKSAEDARYRLKRDKELDANPIKKLAFLQRQQGYGKTQRLKKNKDKAAAEEASIGSRSSSLSESASPPLLKAVDADANGRVKKRKSTSKTILVPETSNILEVFCDFLESSEGEITARDDQNKKRAANADLEQEADPAATKKAKEKKKEYDKVARMKRDEALDADPNKKKAFQSRQQGYEKPRQLKMKKVKEAREVKEDEEEKREKEK
jgi:hypothetical protein